MIIRRVKDFELENALRLIWEVFLKFEAPYFTEEGIKEFKDSIDNPSFIAKMDIFGAFNNNDDERLCELKDGATFMMDGEESLIIMMMNYSVL